MPCAWSLAPGTAVVALGKALSSAAAAVRRCPPPELTAPQGHRRPRDPGLLLHSVSAEKPTVFPGSAEGCVLRPGHQVAITQS